MQHALKQANILTLQAFFKTEISFFQIFFRIFLKNTKKLNKNLIFPKNYDRIAI